MRLYEHVKYEGITTIRYFKKDTRRSITLGDFKCIKFNISLKIEKPYTYGRFIHDKVKKWQYFFDKNNEYFL